VRGKVEGDTNGDGATDLAVKFDDPISFAKGDLVLSVHALQVRRRMVPPLDIQHGVAPSMPRLAAYCMETLSRCRSLSGFLVM